MKLYLGPIYGRYLEPDHVASIFRLLQHPNVLYRPEVNDALVCRARSKVATRFLESDCDVLLSVDSDIMFDPQAALMVAEQAADPRYSMVAGMYVTRSRERCFPTSLFYPGTTIEFGTDPTPVPIKYAATGFLAIHRRVFEALSQRPDLPLCHPTESWSFRPFYQPFVVPGPGGDPIYLSEDFALCERASQAGFQTHLNPAVRLLHLGLHPFRIEDMVTHTPPPGPARLTRLPSGQYRVEVPDETSAQSEPRRLAVASR